MDSSKYADITENFFSKPLTDIAEVIVLPDTIYNVYTRVWSKYGTINNTLKQINVPFSVTSLPADTFYGLSALRSITLPQSLTSIGSNAFQNCSSIKEIQIPNGITSIGENAFMSCSSLETFNIPQSVISIGRSTFYGTAYINDEKNYIDGFCYKDNWCLKGYFGFDPGSIKEGTIGVCCFFACSTIRIPSSVKYLCGLISSTNGYFVVDDKNPYYSSLDGNLYNKDKSALIQMGIDNCGLDKTFVIPSSVVEVHNYTFQRTIGNVVAHANLLKLYSSSFYNVENLIYYGTLSGAPWDATGINIIYDGDFAYKDRSKTILLKYKGTDGSIVIPSDVKEICANAFPSNVSSITLNEGLKKINDSAFNGLSYLTSITIPSTVTDIDFCAFSACGLENIIFNNYYTTLPSFFCSNIKQFEIPSHITAIPNRTFDGCSNLESIVIPNGLTEIGFSAFNGCSRLTSVRIGSSVTSVGEDAFRNCSGIEFIYIFSTDFEASNSAFSGMTSLTDVYFAGTEEEWLDIFTEYDYTGILSSNPTIHYNYVP